MRIKEVTARETHKRASLAYTLIDVMMGVALMGTMMISLYGGIASGFAITKLARENLRSTQIMLERMEGVRLFNWNQLTNSTLIPSTFTSTYYPLATTNGNQGITYYGTMSIGAATNLNPSVGYA